MSDEDMKRMSSNRLAGDIFAKVAEKTGEIPAPEAVAGWADKHYYFAYGNGAGGKDFVGAENASSPPTPNSNKNAVVCSDCGIWLKSQKVIEFSQKRYGKPLCMDCQKKQ